LFEGQHFSFWQKRIEIFIQSIDPGAWNAIVKGPFIHTKESNGELVPKEWDEIEDNEKRKRQDDHNNNNFTCFECGKHGHIKSEYPIYLRKHVGEKKGKKNTK